MRSLLCLLILASVSAHAVVDTSTKFYFEPGAGFSMSRFKASGDESGTAVDESMGLAGFAPSLYAGWRAEYIHLFFGGTYSLLTPTESGEKGAYSLAEYGIGFGWEWNIPGMTTFMIQKTSFTSDQDDGADLGGLGFKIGFAYFITKNIKLNVHWSQFTTEKEELKYTASSAVASLSFPFDIGYPDEWWRERHPGSQMVTSPTPTSTPIPAGEDDSIEPIEDEEGVE